MADRDLTFKEFCSLPEKDRGAGYARLSESDKFRARLSMNPGVLGIPCNSCKHNHRDRTCDAFPNGIDREHIRALIQDTAISCGNGMHYEKQE